jgi:hypothetical protein
LALAHSAATLDEPVQLACHWLVPAEADELLAGSALLSPASLAAPVATQQQLVVLLQLLLRQAAVLSVAALHPRCSPDLAA